MAGVVPPVHKTRNWPQHEVWSLANQDQHVPEFIHVQYDAVQIAACTFDVAVV